jgi:hypothetical protein
MRGRPGWLTSAHQAIAIPGSVILLPGFTTSAPCGDAPVRRPSERHLLATSDMLLRFRCGAQAPVRANDGAMKPSFDRADAYSLHASREENDIVRPSRRRAGMMREVLQTVPADSAPFLNAKKNAAPGRITRLTPARHSSMTSAGRWVKTEGAKTESNCASSRSAKKVSPGRR